MRLALHAEWTKLRTVAGNGWLLAAAVVVTLALSATATAAEHYPAGASVDTIKLSLTGIDLGQALVAVLAVAAIGGEYGTGMIRATLMAVPRRPIVLVAKAAVVGGVTLVAGAISVLGCLLLGRLFLPANGFTVAHGYQLVSLAHGVTLRAAAGSVIYLVFIALLSLGIASVVRDAVLAIGVVLGLLYVLPIAAQVITDPHWHRLLERVAPMTAGLAIQATTTLSGQPIGPWAGLGVLAAWTGSALLLGGVLLILRDA